jgi:hypothetical protein
VYAGTDPLTMHAIRLKSTVKTEQQAYQARQAAQGSVRKSESLPMAFLFLEKGYPLRRLVCWAYLSLVRMGRNV